MADISFDDLIPAKGNGAQAGAVVQQSSGDIDFDDLIPAGAAKQQDQNSSVYDPSTLAALYGGSVMTALTGGNIGGETARRWIGQGVPALAEGIWDSTKAAVTAPGRAYSGELQVMDPAGNVSQEAIGEAANLAGFVSPASVGGQVASTGQRAATSIARQAPEGLGIAQAGQRLGVDLPRAVVSDNAAIQQAGKVVANVPIGGVPLRDASKTAIDQLGDAAMRAQQQYGLADSAAAGAGVRSGLTDFSKNTLAKQVDDRYDAVDDLVTSNVVTPLRRTRQVAGEILGDRLNSQIDGSSRAIAMVQKALSQPDGLNYKGIKGLRTSVGELLKSPAKLAQSGVSENELKAIYGALSDDLRTAVSRGGGAEAYRVFEDANTFAAKVAKEREAFDRILGKNASDENIFSRIEAMAGSTGRADINNLMRLKSSLSKETWGDVAASVLSSIGRDPEGRFSPDRFVTGWGRLSNSGKTLLFKGKDQGDLAQSLDDIAKVSSRFKELNQYANPSGTGGNVFTLGISGGLFFDPVSTVSAVAGSRVLSEILSRPISAKKLANWAKSYEAAAKRPSAGTMKFLEDRAKILSVEMAESLGC